MTVDGHAPPAMAAGGGLGWGPPPADHQGAHGGTAVGDESGGQAESSSGLGTLLERCQGHSAIVEHFCQQESGRPRL